MAGRPSLALSLSPSPSEDRQSWIASPNGSRIAPSPSATHERFPNNATRNPLSLRLYKSLSSSFQDATSQEALDTLSSLYGPPKTAPRLPAPPTDDEDSSSDDEADALAGESGLFNQSVPLGDITVAERARKNSRRDVEQQLISSSIRFLHAFGEVNQKLDVLQTHMDDMRARCDEAQTELSKTSESSKLLLEKAGGLRAQRHATAIRQNIISSFLGRFTLSEAEMESITSHDVPVGKQVFTAMDRAEKIREDCQVLLSGDDGAGTKAGLDIMARTGDQLDNAYAKVQRWCSFEFRQLGKDSHLEVSRVMREAVARLKKRPDILSVALSDLAVIRQTTLLNMFTTALTRGGPSGLPRPIELHAHDPIRYVGDMLAWVHQAMATEREFLDSLFGLHQEKRMVGSSWTRDTKEGESESEETIWVRDLMDKNLEKLCTPLKIRVQQTIKSQEGSITAYKIANLLSFYLLTMRRTIGDEALLTKTLQTVTDLSTHVFIETIQSQGRSLLRFLQPPDADLSPPLALRDVSQVLREIMTVYDSSMLELEAGSTISEETAKTERQEFNRIMDAAVGPALEMCRRMASLKKDGTEREKEIFLVNCVAYLQGTFHPFAFAAARVEDLDRELDSHIALLVAEHYSQLLAESGLSNLIELLKTKPSDTPLSRLPSATPQDITQALNRFDTFLSSLDVLTSPRLSLIAYPTISSRVHREALRKVGDAYGAVCGAVRDPANKYEFAATVLGTKRPFGQMSVLWQVLNISPSST
ncbi:oligomeric complex COG6 [Clavulina sp. PMI_390]|nr:oligomeric complex COG6 [Clavulina sp. PMI_390]